MPANGWPLCQRPYVVLMEVSQTMYLRLNKLSSSSSEGIFPKVDNVDIPPATD